MNPQQRTRPCMLAPLIAGEASERPNLCDVVRWTDHLPEVFSLRLLCLAERDRNGLLSVVADCLDRLLVAPNIPGLLADMGLEPAEAAPGGGSKGARAARKKRTRAVAAPT
jgi:hypothetical protein